LPHLKKRGEVCVGGLVGNVQHKMTKMGKPFGTFVLEDYNESYEFAIFGEDYVKFQKPDGGRLFPAHQRQHRRKIQAKG
jgi:DNA polymerase-3 subunit alpha